MLALLHRPQGLHLAMAKEAVTRAYEMARRVDYAPHSAQMAALRRAEAVLAELKDSQSF